LEHETDLWIKKKMDEVSKKWAVEKVIPIKLSFKQFKSLGLLI